MADARTYPQRPFLAVSAAIFRDGKVLTVRRARKPALNLYTMPGGVVEAGETLFEAVQREVREETALEIEPVALAGHREAIQRDAQGLVERHFIILCLPRVGFPRAGAQRRTRRCPLADAFGAGRLQDHRGPGRHRSGRCRPTRLLALRMIPKTGARFSGSCVGVLRPPCECRGAGAYLRRYWNQAL